MATLDHWSAYYDHQDGKYYSKDIEGHGVEITREQYIECEAKVGSDLADYYSDATDELAISKRITNGSFMSSDVTMQNEVFQGEQLMDDLMSLDIEEGVLI